MLEERLQSIIEAANNSLPVCDYKSAVLDIYSKKLSLLQRSMQTCENEALATFLNEGKPLEDLLARIDSEFHLIGKMAQWKPWDK